MAYFRLVIIFPSDRLSHRASLTHNISTIVVLQGNYLFLIKAEQQYLRILSFQG